MSEPAGTHYSSKLVKVILPASGNPAVYEVAVAYATNADTARFYGNHRATRIAGVWFELKGGVMVPVQDPAAVKILEDMEVLK